MYLRVAIADHFIIVIILFLECRWPWPSEQLEDMLDYYLRMIERERFVLFLLPLWVIERVRHVGVRRVVSGTRYFLVRALAATRCSCGTNPDRADVVGWYSHVLTSKDVYSVPVRRSKQRRTCPGLMSHTPIDPVKRDERNWMNAATDNVQWETDLAVAAEHRSCDRPVKARKKSANTSSTDNVPVA